MKNLKSLRLAVLFLCGLLFITSDVFAGTKGKISGKVKDESGETLIGVQVVIEGTTRGTTTDIDGNYTIINLDPGTYTLVFSYLGFACKIHEHRSLPRTQMSPALAKYQQDC